MPIETGTVGPTDRNVVVIPKPSVSVDTMMAAKRSTQGSKGGGQRGDPAICPQPGRTCDIDDPDDTGCYIQDTQTALNGWFRHDHAHGSSYATSSTEFRVGNNCEINREFAEGIMYITDGPIINIWADMYVKVPHINFLNGTPTEQRQSGGSHFFRFTNICGLASCRNSTSDQFEIHHAFGCAAKSGFRLKIVQWDEDVNDPDGCAGTPIQRDFIDDESGAQQSTFYDTDMGTYRMNWGASDPDPEEEQNWLRFQFGVKMHYISPATKVKAWVRYLKIRDTEINLYREREFTLARPPEPIRGAQFGNWDQDFDDNGDPTHPDNQGFEIKELQIINPQR